MEILRHEMTSGVHNLHRGNKRCYEIHYLAFLTCGRHILLRSTSLMNHIFESREVPCLCPLLGLQGRWACHAGHRRGVLEWLTANTGVEDRLDLSWQSQSLNGSLIRLWWEVSLKGKQRSQRRHYQLALHTYIRPPSSSRLSRGTQLTCHCIQE